MQADNQTSLRIDIGRFNETYFKFRGLPEAQIVPLFQQNPVFFLLYPMLKRVFQQTSITIKKETLSMIE
jgi:hypothetical protein